jgi:1,4-alpha-glucan branching enzyme
MSESRNTPSPSSSPAPSEFLTDYDIYLLNEGRHWHAYEKLGAHLRTLDGVKGVQFTVWAPNAHRVSVVGDFNDWDGRKHRMSKLIPSGFWELFVPEADVNSLYKFEIKSDEGTDQRADPVGFAVEAPPRNASVVADLSQHKWNDADWMEERANVNPLERPMSIYEVHLGSWRQDPNREHGWMSYRDLAHQLVEYVKESGFTHIELLPVAAHPYTASWGYQCIGYFAPTARYGSPEDLMYFVDHCHQNGIGVLVDWVPAHFPKDAHGLRRFDGTALYEHEDPRQGEHPDWGTLVFNYGRCEVCNYLISNAIFWLDKYHIDGLRVDAVASMLYLDYSREEGEWVPNKFGGRENIEAIEFLQEMNKEVHSQFPGAITVAEESTAWPGVSRPVHTGGLGFTMKWNMGWMNDSLHYFSRDPIHRKFHHDELTFSIMYAFHENFVLPYSHDEVVHGKYSLWGKMPGDDWRKAANLRLLYSYMWTHPGKKLLFMGSEFGQKREWNHEQPLDWYLLDESLHEGVRRCVADLNRLLCTEPALYERDFEGGGFEWIDCNNMEDSSLSYIRKGKDPSDFLVVVCNFTPIPRTLYEIGVPHAGVYDVIFNSDSEWYGGSNTGNGMPTTASTQEHHGRPATLRLVLPPLGILILKPQLEETKKA